MENLTFYLVDGYGNKLHQTFDCFADAVSMAEHLNCDVFECTDEEHSDKCVWINPELEIGL